MSDRSVETLLHELVRDIPDWPEPGVTFRDITPLLADAEALQAVVDALTELGRSLAGGPIDRVLGIEARGFILAAPVALALGAGFVPVRKAGKLPGPTYAVSYALEYGEATLEMHRDALAPGDRALVIDDVLATGGTVAATARLVGECGATHVGTAVLLELEALHGRDRLAGMPVGALRRL
ncbi:adenine phosphoribosyltransferase [Solicola gregarius]|uniref:Adenine phosphoribosyltransferase n=1 Tax=Solicola gregarius TaxID=2908642 RepID=A0AA46TGP7_9ACTN|nr:adenine phosphoribosyltransferase [Solicola gregarius]UYM04806.1 adenine phosphoribosyltransferase [Solicola gregarius]